MGQHGWPFKNADPSWPDADDDSEHPNFKHIKDLYFLADRYYTGRHVRFLSFAFPCYIYIMIRFTVPVLWDNKLSTIVNNESSEIIRIFNTAFNHLLPTDKAAIDIYPEAHRQEIDSINEWVYDTVNSASESVWFVLDLTSLCAADGVYKAGFASTQSAYENAVYPLFKSLDRLEEMLNGKDYLVGNTLTEADIRLFVTAVRTIL